MELKDLKEVYECNVGIMDVVETGVADWLIEVGQDDWDTLHKALDALDESESPEDEVISALAMIGLQRIAGLCIERTEAA